MQDWNKNSKLVVSNIENPVCDRPDQPAMIGVHKGFRQYLYGESRTVTTELSSRSISASFYDDDVETTTTTNHPFQNKDLEDLSAGDDAISESVATKQEDQLSTSNLLKFLGLDLSAINEKRKLIQSSVKWNGTASLMADESEDESKKKNSGLDFSTLFNTGRTRTNNKSRLGRILDEIKSLQRQYNDYIIYVTGHSLGGALGLLAALEVAERFGKLDQPVTFVGIGNPRAGTEVSDSWLYTSTNRCLQGN